MTRQDPLAANYGFVVARYTVYTDSTPNPFKILIALEELGVPYTTHPVNFLQGEQRSSELLRLNPNGRIPILIDHEHDDLVVIESGAILLHLAEQHDALLPREFVRRSEAVQWLMWQMGGLGPMFGQLLVFAGAYENTVPRATARYQQEVRRLLGVLDTRLQNRDFIADEHSIADIACMGWMWPIDRIGWTLQDWPNLAAWHARCMARPAYPRGFAAAGTKSEGDRMTGFKRAVVGLDEDVPAPG